jgi:DNA-directed RNA polymerase sigma subunit (sigma70/sigma32)
MDHLDPKTSEGAIRAFAFRVARRLHAAGEHSLTKEDLEQEGWVAWCIAIKNYDAESGVPFLAYLRSGLHLHLNRYVEKHVERRIDEVHALSLDKPFGEEEDGELGEVIPSAAPSPLEALEERSAVIAISGMLSDEARLFVKLLYEQPESLLNEVLRVGDRCDYAREQGVVMNFNNRITKSMVFDLMGIATPKRGIILKEIDKAVASAQRREMI